MGALLWWRLNALDETANRDDSPWTSSGSRYVPLLISATSERGSCAPRREAGWMCISKTRIAVFLRAARPTACLIRTSTGSSKGLARRTGGSSRPRLKAETIAIGSGLHWSDAPRSSARLDEPPDLHLQRNRRPSHQSEHTNVRHVDQGNARIPGRGLAAPAPDDSLLGVGGI
jgi:hypothetical protein